VTRKALTAGGADPIASNPGAHVSWLVTVTNSGAAPIEVGELHASLPTLTGPGAPIGGISIAPDPATISIAPNADRAFTILAASAANQTVGDYAGDVRWVLCDRAPVDQHLALHVNPLACGLTLASLAPATADPGSCATLTTTLTNGQCTLRNPVASCSALSGPGGVIPVTLSLSDTDLAPGASSTVQVSTCPVSCLQDGEYTATLLVTGSTDFGSQEVRQAVTVRVTSKSIVASPVGPAVAAPGAAVQWIARVTNDGTAPILRVSSWPHCRTERAGPGDRRTPDQSQPGDRFDRNRRRAGLHRDYVPGGQPGGRHLRRQHRVGRV
jgi:hypothetical protein